MENGRRGRSAGASVATIAGPDVRGATSSAPSVEMAEHFGVYLGWYTSCFFGRVELDARDRSTGLSRASSQTLQPTHSILIMTRLTRTRNRNLNGLQNEIDRVFDRFFPSRDENEDSSSPQAVWRPRMDLIEMEDAYRLHLDMPGMSTDDLTISYKDNELVVSGERESSRADENEEFVRVERSFGHFRRAFTLPQTVDADNIDATYDNGVLTIRVPKTEAVKPRQIEIQ